MHFKCILNQMIAYHSLFSSDKADLCTGIYFQCVFHSLFFIYKVLYRSVNHCHCFSFDNVSLHCLQSSTSVLLILDLYLMYCFYLFDVNFFNLHVHFIKLQYGCYCVLCVSFTFITSAGMCFMHLYCITHWHYIQI